MPVHSTVEPVSVAVEQLLLNIGRAGVLSSRVIAVGELETLLRLLGPPSERQRSDLKRATDVVLVEAHQEGPELRSRPADSCMRAGGRDCHMSPRRGTSRLSHNGAPVANVP